MIIKEWETEPDEEDFTYKNYDCVILRDEDLKYLCGYVRIPTSHSYYKKIKGIPNFPNLFVHGGITFSGSFMREGKWIGFDCAHGFDLIPFTFEEFPIFYEKIPPHYHHYTYKNFAYVRAQLESLVDQLIEIKGNICQNLK